MPQRRRLHHGWTWVPPLRCHASICNCAVCVLWAQLKGDSLQALLNILGVEVDDHPAPGSFWDDAIAKLSALAKPATLARKPKPWQTGGSSLDDHYRCVGEQFLVIQCAECVGFLHSGV